VSEIKPALTAEEWRLRHVENVGLVWRVSDDTTGLVEIEARPYRATWSGDRPDFALVADRINQGIACHRVDAAMALANAARPDSDEGKITRADVNALEQSAALIAELSGYAHADRLAELIALAAKLAALLPPEEPT
jgi:hypothetical protein